jgi:large subunit ribosomal protein L3
MPTKKHPRRGSMQFWPRKRSMYSLARVRSWATSKNTKPLGFIAYKAGMTHVMANDNRPKSITKGETVSLPVTIVECPPMHVVAVTFYKKSILSNNKVLTVNAPKLEKEMARKIQVPKKRATSFDNIPDYTDIKIVVSSNPKMTGIGVKKPKVIEIAIGGSKEDKLAYAKEILGKTINIEDVFEEGVQIDVHGISIGKGFQGTVKRYGVPIKQHKGEKNKRGIGNLGAWTPKRVDYRVPQSGKMGYHLRTEYNKQILKLAKDGSELTPKSGIIRYGVVKNSYLLVHGSLIGPKKRAILLTAARRINNPKVKEPYQITTITK